jgi:hypothetical protein
MPTLVDTGILLRGFAPADQNHQQVRLALCHLRRERDELVTSFLNIAEFVNVSTNEFQNQQSALGSVNSAVNFFFNPQSQFAIVYVLSIRRILLPRQKPSGDQPGGQRKTGPCDKTCPLPTGHRRYRMSSSGIGSVCTFVLVLGSWTIRRIT